MATRKTSRDNRIPVYVLAALVLVAVVWRLANPPEPLTPGPYGGFPNWVSSADLGSMSSQAINPSGNMWAGSWNHKPKSGDPRSSIWLIDFDKCEARVVKLPDGNFVTDVGWADDATVWALTGAAGETPDKLAYVDSRSAKATKTVRLKGPVDRILSWPAGSAVFLGERTKGGVVLALHSANGEIVSKEIKPDLSRGRKLYTDTAISPDRTLFVYSVQDSREPAGRAYYLANGRDGSVKRLFALGDLPGRVERLWVADWGVMVACVERNKMETVVYDIAAGKFVDARDERVNATWFTNGAMKPLMFVTYDGGYRFDPGTGKTRQLFDFTKLGEQDSQWREAVNGGRLYSIGDGYVSLSVVANTVDIRELKKDGTFDRNLLPRY